MDRIVLSRDAIKDIFRKAISFYKEYFHVDLSYMKIKISKYPEDEEGNPEPDKVTELAGSRTSKGYVVIRPEPFDAVSHYGADNDTIENFITRVTVHELAHEVYEEHYNARVKKFIGYAKKHGFSTTYLENEGYEDDEESEVELFAEFMAYYYFYKNHEKYPSGVMLDGEEVKRSKE